MPSVWICLLLLMGCITTHAEPSSPVTTNINGAVLGIATGQVLSIQGICAFVNSFRRTTSGKIVLFVPDDKAHVLTNQQTNETIFKLYDNVEVVKVDFEKYGNLPAVR